MPMHLVLLILNQKLVYSYDKNLFNILKKFI